MDVTESDRALVIAEQKLEAIRELAEKKVSQHGQCWNSIFGRELLTILDADL